MNFNILDGNDADFAKRVWSTDPEIYLNRLKAINFNNFDKVLDAGCGVGQWTLALSKLNKSIEAIEYCPNRFSFCKNLVTELNFKNVNFTEGSIESLPFDDAHFDAIFCYSVIFLTDFKKALKEFSRVLKVGGTLYLNANGLGWYLYNLIVGHNDTGNFNSKKMAIESISNSINYYALGKVNPGNSLIMPKQVTIHHLKEVGFVVNKIGPEGTISFSDIIPKSFFKGEYFDDEGVYELVATKQEKI
ncbi:MAG TPA: class I SAM-dependent methyltransferase [Oligoflexia bacterium]|nr:class I SAM-dependent methyltransferase [Oligoflexia bacterium]HMP48569.1 class I SAM-dependent methyltransferase [Oligoflexia bacterium]